MIRDRLAGGGESSNSFFSSSSSSSMQGGGRKRVHGSREVDNGIGGGSLMRRVCGCIGGRGEGKGIVIEVEGG